MEKNVLQRIEDGSLLISVKSLSHTVPALVYDHERAKEIRTLIGKGLKFDSLLSDLKLQLSNMEVSSLLFCHGKADKRQDNYKISMIKKIIEQMEGGNIQNETE